MRDVDVLLFSFAGQQTCSLFRRVDEPLRNAVSSLDAHEAQQVRPVLGRSAAATDPVT